MRKLNYNRAIRIINHTSKPNFPQIHIRIRGYKNLAWSTFTYGAQTWTTCNHDESRIKATEIKFKWRIVCYYNEGIKYITKHGIHRTLHI
jgi:hypothetical protein